MLIFVPCVWRDPGLVRGTISLSALTLRYELLSDRGRSPPLIRVIRGLRNQLQSQHYQFKRSRYFNFLKQNWLCSIFSDGNKKDSSYIRVRFVNVIMPLWIHVPATVIRVKGHLSASLHKWYQVCAIILSQFSPSLDEMVVKRMKRCLIILNKDEYFVPKFIKLLKILKKC